MSEFINSVGMSNFIFLIVIVSVILLTIIILLVIERKKNVTYVEVEKENEETYYNEHNTYQEDSYVDNNYNDSYDNTYETNYESNNYNNEYTYQEEYYDNNNYSNQPTNEYYEEYNYSLEEEPVLEVHNDDFSNNYVVEEIEEEVREELLKDKEVVYYEEETKPEVVKNKLDEIARKLVDEPEDKSGPTVFEKEQEESSVISYEELKKINYNIDDINDRSMLEEEDLPISIKELTKKEEKINEIKEEILKIEEHENTTLVEIDDEEVYDGKTFKNSDFISPVFGVYNKKASLSYKTEDLDKTVELEDLEKEIRKTEEFLRELKKLKGKLD